MKYTLSTSAVSQMADRIVAKYPQEMTKPKALEMLSAGFGYRNFDTLNGVLKAREEGASAQRRFQWPAMTLKSSLRMWFAAYSPAEGESPDWVLVLLTPDLLAKLAERHQALNALQLGEMAFWSTPLDWDDGDEDSPLQMSGWRLCLTEDCFWYEGWPKHSSVHCETYAVYLAELAAALADKTYASETIVWQGDDLYVAGSSSRLEALKSAVEPR